MRSNGSGRGRSTPSPLAELGRCVRQRRRELRLDQLQLCALARVGPAFLYQLEHGKRTCRLDKVLAVLGVLGLELHVRDGRDGLTIESRLRSGDA